MLHAAYRANIRDAYQSMQEIVYVRVIKSLFYTLPRNPEVSFSSRIQTQQERAYTGPAAHNVGLSQQSATIEFSNQDCQHVFLVLQKHSNSSSSSSSSSDTLMAAEVRSAAVAGLPHWSTSCRNRELGLPS